MVEYLILFFLFFCCYCIESNVESCKYDSRAFVFLKPTSNNALCRSIVSQSLSESGIIIAHQGEISANEIVEKNLIRNHYFSISSKATFLKPQMLPSPGDSFEKQTGMSWEDALSKNLIFTAEDACKFFDIDKRELYELWKQSSFFKIGSGCYCAQIAYRSQSIFVINGFYFDMERSFTVQGTSIHYFIVEFSSAHLSWKRFREEIIGSTNPQKANPSSIRGRIWKNWRDLGLSREPSTGENGIHGSASPFEAFVEERNWLGASSTTVESFFASELRKLSIDSELIEKWSRDPIVNNQSLFDSLEGLDTEDCLTKMEEISKLSR